MSRVNIHSRLALLVCVLALLGCSHTTPYFRADLMPRNVGNQLVPDDAVRSRILLVGDAGETDAKVLEDVARWAAEHPAETVVVFLGDNMYPEGMTPRRRDEAPERLLPQIVAATGGGGRALFVPGNHDWADGEEEGYQAILEQAAYVNRNLPHNDGFLPASGCPGPVAVDRLEGVRIVALDTQWWLHDGEKPTTTCSEPDPQEVVAALSRVIDVDRNVVIVAHHPLFGYGRHAGFSDWTEHLRYPLVGSLIALSRKLPLRDQDYNSRRYKAMVDAFRSALEGSPGPDGLLVWASGHEHNLQVLEGEATDYVLISGSGAHTTPVNHGEETLFAHSHPGFMVLDFLASGSVLLRVVEPETGEVLEFPLEGS